MTKQPEGSAREIALKRCADLIEWYERQKSRTRFLDNVLQTSVILAAGLTAFAASIETWPKWAIVLPAVITTIATGLSANFRFRSKYVSFASAGERLKWVLLRYQIRSESAPADPGSLEEFVNSMERRSFQLNSLSGEKATWQETSLESQRPLQTLWPETLSEIETLLSADRFSTGIREILEHRHQVSTRDVVTHAIAGKRQFAYEMTLAVWLIVKGFNSSVLVSRCGT